MKISTLASYGMVRQDLCESSWRNISWGTSHNLCNMCYPALHNIFMASSQHLHRSLRVRLKGMWNQGKMHIQHSYKQILKWKGWRTEFLVQMTSIHAISLCKPTHIWPRQQSIDLWLSKTLMCDKQVAQPVKHWQAAPTIPATLTVHLQRYRPSYL